MVLLVSYFFRLISTGFTTLSDTVAAPRDDVAREVKLEGNLANMKVHHRLCGPLPAVNDARVT